LHPNGNSSQSLFLWLPDAITLASIFLVAMRRSGLVAVEQLTLETAGFCKLMLWKITCTVMNMRSNPLFQYCYAVRECSLDAGSRRIAQRLAFAGFLWQFVQSDEEIKLVLCHSRPELAFAAIGHTWSRCCYGSLNSMLLC